MRLKSTLVTAVSTVLMAGTGFVPQGGKFRRMWGSHQRDCGQGVGDHHAKRRRRVPDRLALWPASAECQFRHLQRRSG
jgi:hypothetical protein